MTKREEHLQFKIDNEIKQAREFSKVNKKREALTCIKRKKMYEKQLEQLSGAKMTLETQRLALENININKETIEAQRTATQAMQAATRQMGGVDAVEDTMDQVEEGLQDADEIGQAMARSVNTGIDADDDVRACRPTLHQSPPIHPSALPGRTFSPSWKGSSRRTSTTA